MLAIADAKVSGADTVMRVTQRNAKVTTRFGGDFVQGISGISGGRRDGRPVDWFIYLDGILTDQGAGGLRVAGGERIWWDHHEWGLTPDVPAVVGSFPEPFRHGAGGRTPVKVQCELPRVAGLRRGRATARQARRRRDARPASPQRARRVAAHRRRGLDGAARRHARGPQPRAGARSPAACSRASATTARASRCSIRAARVAKRLAGDAGLIAATRQPGRPPVWFVTGTDAGGVTAAAQAFDESVLRNHFAIATSTTSRCACRRPGADGLMARRDAASPLHAARAPVAAAYACALVTAALAFEHPLVLAALGVAILGAGVLAGAGHQLLRACIFGVPFALMIALVNPLVAREGLDVVLRLGDLGPLGTLDVTQQSLVFGAILGMRALLVVLAGAALLAAIVDADELLRRFRGISARSALTAALAVRLVPVLGRDARRLADARRCRPGAAARRPVRPPSACRSCARSRPARWTARSTSPRRSRCAATPARPRAAGPGARASPGRATTSR